MSRSSMEPRYRDALRAALVEHVHARATRPRWPRWAAAGGLGLVLVGGGAAVAADVWHLPYSEWQVPGEDVVTELGRLTTVTGTGTETVDLGDAPVEATSLELQFRCLSAGRFTFDDGSSVSCLIADAESPTRGRVSLTLDAGPTSTTITTDRPEARWELSFGYSHREPTEWAVNASGDTYGGIADDGSLPDLVAIYATNGVQGYAYRTDLEAAEGPMPTSPEQALAQQEEDLGRTVTIPVYASDGETVVGEFDFGG